MTLINLCGRYPILSYPILSYPILSYPINSFLEFYYIYRLIYFYIISIPMIIGVYSLKKRFL